MAATAGGLVRVARCGAARGLAWTLPALLLCGGAAGVARAATPRLYITTELSAPTSMIEHGRVTGSATDKVRAIMARSGIDYSIVLLPWKRAYTEALARPNGCVYSTSRTAEREALFKWIGPTDEAVWVLMGRADSKITLHTLEDARPYRIGTYHGDARDAYLRERGFTVDPAPAELTNPRKLLLGRIDLWAAGLRRGSNLIEHHGWSAQIVPLYTFNRIQVYLACNRAVPDALVARMNAAVGALVRDGSMRRIERRYDNWQPGPDAAE